MIMWLLFLVALLVLVSPLILLMWALPAWASGLLPALVLGAVLLGDVWFGWRMAKTERQKMIWWLGVITMILTLLWVLYSEGVIGF
jgi:hypothetical protein